MRKAKDVPKAKTGGLHWSDSIWILVVLVAIGFYELLGIQAAVMAGIVAGLILVGVQNFLQVRKEQTESHRDTGSEGFWNPHR